MAIGPCMCSDVISGRAKEVLPAQLLVPPNMGGLLHSLAPFRATGARTKGSRLDQWEPAQHHLGLTCLCFFHHLLQAQQHAHMILAVSRPCSKHFKVSAPHSF